MIKKPELGIYIHIPFCIHKCLYCDFISFQNKLDKQEEYVKKLLQEIENEKKIFEDYEITSIYIGGGTPSAIDSKWIRCILNKIDECKKIKNIVKEITIEVNPRYSYKAKAY